jgi:sulfur-carrier protein
VNSVRVTIPVHLQTLARVGGEIRVHVDGPVTVASVLEAVEAAYPMLRGTIRPHGTDNRRAFIRFFACGQDLSHEPTDQPLPEPVARGEEPLCVIGAIAGG